MHRALLFVMSHALVLVLVLVLVLGGAVTRGLPAPPQDVLQLGGVELLLSQCQLDEDSPLTREWALWAIRNLSIGNAAVQERIKVSAEGLMML